MALQYFCQIRGREFGPMSGSELATLAKMGKLSEQIWCLQKTQIGRCPQGEFATLYLAQLHLNKRKFQMCRK